MKKKSISFTFIISILLIIFIVGCKGKAVDESNGESLKKIGGNQENVIENDEETIMKDFKTMIKSDNEPFTLIKFIDENIKKVNIDYATEMIRQLEEVQENYIERYTEQLFMEEHQMELLTLSGSYKTETGKSEEEIEKYLFFDVTKAKEIKNANLKELVSKILQGKYRLINIEGAFYPIIDYEALKVYNDYLSDEIKEYIDLKSMDSNMPTVLETEIIISFDQLVERIIRTENYILKYPDSIRHEEALRLYGSYLNLYFEGSPNTLIYNNETRKIKDEVLASYKKTRKIDKTVISKVVSKYIDIIKTNDYIIDENVLSKITELHSEAIAILER